MDSLIFLGLCAAAMLAIAAFQYTGGDKDEAMVTLCLTALAIAIGLLIISIDKIIGLVF